MRRQARTGHTGPGRPREKLGFESEYEGKPLAGSGWSSDML